MELQIVGRLTKNAQVNTTPSGKEVINFDVAVNERYRVKATGELKSDTKYVQCAMWFGASLSKYMLKGKQVHITGDIGTNAYLTKDNKPAAVLTLRVNKINLLDKKDDAASLSQATTPATPAGGEETDDLPF